jgi:hypothetical protein
VFTNDLLTYSDDSWYFMAKVEDLKKAIAYYHDSLGHKSRVLSFFHNGIYPEGSQRFLLRFKFPKVLPKELRPTLKQPNVILNLSPYCRNYEGLYEI